MELNNGSQQWFLFLQPLALAFPSSSSSGCTLTHSIWSPDLRQSTDFALRQRQSDGSEGHIMTPSAHFPTTESSFLTVSQLVLILRSWFDSALSWAPGSLQLMRTDIGFLSPVQQSLSSIIPLVFASTKSKSMYSICFHLACPRCPFLCTPAFWADLWRLAGSLVCSHSFSRSSCSTDRFQKAMGVWLRRNYSNGAQQRDSSVLQTELVPGAGLRARSDRHCDDTETLQAFQFTATWSLKLEYLKRTKRHY